MERKVAGYNEAQVCELETDSLTLYELFDFGEDEDLAEVITEALEYAAQIFIQRELLLTGDAVITTSIKDGAVHAFIDDVSNPNADLIDALFVIDIEGLNLTYTEHRIILYDYNREVTEHHNASKYFEGCEDKNHYRVLRLLLAMHSLLLGT
jgi:hypothetical protein